ncbi:MAG: quinol:cytochrome C oxidoreductase, partial [Bacteroidota bacterium]
KVINAIVNGNTSGLSDNLKTAAAAARKELQVAGSKGVLVTGVQDAAAQAMVLEFNASSEVLDTAALKYTRSGDINKVNQLVREMNAGQVGLLIMAGVNPAYTLANAAEFNVGLEKVGVSVACSMMPDETASLATHIAPTPHYLESWGDVQIKQGEVSLTQPTIKPLFDTRQFQESLVKWMDSDQSYYDYLKSTIVSAGVTSFNQAVQDGVVMTNAFAKAISEEQTSATSDAAHAVTTLPQTGFELTLYTKTSMGAGNQGNNPWLQEMPDPITRATWDNYLTMSEADAKELDLWLDRSTFFTEARNDANGGLNGKLANVTVNGVTIENVPVMVQPGQAKGSVGLALGYGNVAGTFDDETVGINAYPLFQNGSLTQGGVTIEKASGMHEFAVIQLHNTLMGRGDIVKETTLEIFNTKDK